jgi:hypothetical protein
VIVADATQPAAITKPNSIAGLAQAIERVAEQHCFRRLGHENSSLLYSTLKG